jgi:hypothetical protein
MSVTTDIETTNQNPQAQLTTLSRVIDMDGQSLVPKAHYTTLLGKSFVLSNVVIIGRYCLVYNESDLVVSRVEAKLNRGETAPHYPSQFRRVG